MSDSSNETIDWPSHQTATGSSDLSLWGNPFEPTAASHYLETVRRSIKNPQIEFDRDLLRAAILTECQEQIERDGSVTANSFAWLRDHEATHLETLFPGHRHATHDPSNFPTSIGKFVLLGVIGHGGFATVYRAIDITYQRHVALKALNAGAAVGERPRRQMLEEAKLLQETNCAHVVRVYGVYEIGRETLISMRMIDGGNLSEILQQGPLSRTESAEMVRQVATGIAAAHERKIVHRDLKPGNVLRDRNHCWFVADFGLAKRLDRSISHSSPTHAVGTWAYSAPEQLKYQDANEKTDIFALGLLLFEAATAERAFQADGPTGRLAMIENQIGIGSRKSRRLLGDSLYAIVTKCLQPYPEHRYESVAHLQHDLASYLAGTSVSVHPPSLIEDFGQVFRRRKKSVLMLALISLVVLTSLVMLMDASTRRRMGVELQRQGLVASALGDLVDPQALARDRALVKLRHAAELRIDNDLVDPFIAAHLKPGTVAQWEIAGKPFHGFDVTDDGQTAAVATDDGGIRIVTRGSNEWFELRSGIAQPALFLEWSRRGQYLAAMHGLPAGASNDDRRPFFVWDLRQRCVLEAIPSGIHDEGWAFTQSTEAIVVANAKSSQIETIDLETGRLLHHFSIPEQRWVRGLAVDPSEAWIAIAYAKHRLAETRDLPSGNQIDQWLLPHEISDIDAGPAGLVAVASGNNAYLFESGQSQARSIIHAHSAPLDRIRFSARGDRVLTRSYRQGLKIWNSLTGGLQLVDSATRHVRFVDGDRQLAGLVSQQGFQVSGLSQDDLKPVLKSPAIHGTIRDACFSGDGSHVYLASDDGIVAWNLHHPSLPPAIIDRAPTGDVQCVFGNLLSSHRFALRFRGRDEIKPGLARAWSHSTSDHHYGSLLAADLAGNRIAVVQQALSKIAVIDSDSTRGVINLQSRNVSAIAISDDANWLASSSWDIGSPTYLWNLDRPDQRYKIPASASGMLFLRDSRRLVTGAAADYTIWDVGTRKAIHKIPRRVGTTDAPLAISPDGSMLALLIDDENVSIVDPASLQARIHLPTRQSNQIKKLVFSSSGCEMAALLQDGSVVMWRLDRLRSRCESEGLSWPIETPADAPENANLPLSNLPLSNLPLSNLPVAKRFRDIPTFDWLPNALLVGTSAVPVHRRIESLRDRIKKTPDDIGAHDQLARECLGAGGVQESLRIYQAAHGIQPTSERRYFIGLLLSALGMDEDYAKLVELIADQSFDDDGQGLWLTRLVLLSPDADSRLTAAALKATNKQLAAAPDNQWLLTIQSLALIRVAKPEQAVEILRQDCNGEWGKLDSFEKAIAALALRKSGNDPEADAVVEIFTKHPDHRFPDLRLYAEQLIAEAR